MPELLNAAPTVSSDRHSRFILIVKFDASQVHGF